MRAQYYTDNVLQGVVVSLFGVHPDLHTNQQDNARAHTARLTMQVLANAHVPVLEWPALSPDLSPIEHLWHELGRGLQHRQLHVWHLQQALQGE